MLYESKFLISLLLTLVIEIPVLLLFINVLIKKKINYPKIIFAGFLASTLSLPYLWFILPAFIKDFKYYSLIGEISVFLIEAFIYSQVLKLNAKNSLVASFFANLCSFLAGI